jgi:hypothetical protein
MRRVRRGNVVVRGMLALALVVGGSAVLAAPAGAAPSEKDCALITDLDAPDSGASSPSDLKALAAQGKALTENSKKVSDKKVAAAMKTLGSIYTSASKARNQALAVAVIARSGTKFTKALTTWGKALTACITSSISLPPDVTVPKR